MVSLSFWIINHIVKLVCAVRELQLANTYVCIRGVVFSAYPDHSDSRARIKGHTG